MRIAAGLFFLILAGTAEAAPRTSDCERIFGIRVIEIDMLAADGYVVTEFELVRRALAKYQFNLEKILLRGLDAGNLRALIRDGTDHRERDWTHAYTLKEIDRLDPPILRIVEESRVPAIAVYDAAKMIHVYDLIYRFASPADMSSALLAVLLLRY